MFTRVCPRKKVKEASAMLPFSPAVREVAGRCLVLVFAAMRRHLALRSARVIEHVTAAMLNFVLLALVKPAVIYAIFRMIASTLNRNLHDMTIFLVYI